MLLEVIRVTLQWVGDPLHFIGGLHSFGVGFIGALRGEDRHHRLDDRDVGAFEHPEREFRTARAAGHNRRCGARFTRRRKQRRPDRTQAFGRREEREPNPPDLTMLAADEIDRDAAVGRHVDRGRFGRHANSADPPAVGVPQRSVARARERAVARVGMAAVALERKEPGAVDRDVEWAAASFEFSLLEEPANAERNRAEIVADRAERRRRAFETGDVGVGEVVGDDVKRLLLRGHPGRRSVQRAVHDFTRATSLASFARVSSSAASVFSAVSKARWAASTSTISPMESTLERSMKPLSTLAPEESRIRSSTFPSSRTTPRASIVAPELARTGPRSPSRARPRSSTSAPLESSENDAERSAATAPRGSRTNNEPPTAARSKVRPVRSSGPWRRSSAVATTSPRSVSVARATRRGKPALEALARFEAETSSRARAACIAAAMRSIQSMARS